MQRLAIFGLGFGPFGASLWRRLLVVGVQVEELDAGGGAAGGVAALGVDVDDLAELADEHHLGSVVDEVDVGDFDDPGVVFMQLMPLPLAEVSSISPPQRTVTPQKSPWADLNSPESLSSP